MCHLDGGHQERQWQHVESLLVVDVVPDVEQVPQAEEGANLRAKPCAAARRQAIVAARRFKHDRIA